MSIVQSLWIGDALPEIQRLSVSSFLAHGYTYHLYAYDEIHGVPSGAVVCDAAAILPRESIFCYRNGFGKGSYSAFSNLFRYTLIFERGGWWVDTDVVCLKPLAFDDHFVFATEHETDFSIQCSTSVFRSEPRAPFLAYCADVVTSRDKETLQWGEVGPMLFDDAVKRFDLTRHCVSVETFSPINYFEFEQIIEGRFDLSRLEHSAGVHLWNQMWRSRDLDPAVCTHSDSLYGILKNRYLG
jgi:hypothetical protein